MLVTPFGVASQGHQPAQVILKLQASGLLAPVEAVRFVPDQTAMRVTGFD